MSDAAMSSLIKKLLTGGYKRRVFVSFDRNHYATPDVDVREQTTLSHRLILAERFVRQVSKSLGFNQIMTSSVSSLDLAEVSLYNSSDQPGMRAVHALYPSKSYRIYVCQFMAGDNLIPFPPAFSIPGELLFKNTASLTKSLHARSVAASNTLSKSVVNKYKAINAIKDSTYSYGVRLRNMQDELATQLAITKSESDFRDQYGDTELSKMQTRLESKSGASYASSSYLDPRLISSIRGPDNRESRADDPVQKIIAQQEEVEDSVQGAHIDGIQNTKMNP